MLHLLDALQTLEQGGTRVQLSYQALDVEQIGHVYEGLLDHTAVRITDLALGLGGKLEPEIAFGDLEAWTADGRARREARKGERAQRQSDREGPGHRARRRGHRASARRLRATTTPCFARVRRYHGLLRDRPPRRPARLPRRFAVRNAGPRSSIVRDVLHAALLAEEVVKHTLDPVAYRPGPAEEPDPDKWVLRPASELLDLKVADIAMGSGAFLVARLPISRRSLARGLGRARRGRVVGLRRGPPRAADAACRPGRPVAARGARSSAGHRTLSLWRRQEPDGRRDGQALALARDAREGSAVQLRRPRAARGRLAAWDHEPRPAPGGAPRRQTAATSEPGSRLRRDRARNVQGAAAPRAPRGVRRPRRS